MQPDKPPSVVPGNFSGSLAAGVAAVAVGWLTKAGYIAVVAGAVGLPEASVVALAGGLIVAGVSYAVTHVAAIKNVNDLYNVMPQTYPEYPHDPKTSIANGPANGNFNQSGDGHNG